MSSSGKSKSIYLGKVLAQLVVFSQSSTFGIFVLDEAISQLID